jgi:hypothetical protein
MPYYSVESSCIINYAAFFFTCMCCDLLISPVHIDRESLNLRQKHEIFVNGLSSTKRTRARKVIIREHVFSTSTAVRQVCIVPCHVHILLMVRLG